MKYIKGFFLFWYDFIVGDAWEVAAGVALTLVILYVLLHSASGAGVQVMAAILFPLVTMVLLTYSILRVRKPH
jgi:hypothetical protein